MSNHTPTVVRLHRRPPAALLRRRDEAAQRWAEQVSHGLPANQTFEALVRLELALAEWPEHNGLATAVADARLLHSEETPIRACRICVESSLVDPAA